MSKPIELAPRNARREGEALLIEIIHFSLRWQHVQPEDARSYFQDWTDSLSEVDLSEREIKSLRRSVRQRRWRVPVEAMNKFEAELSKKLEAVKGQPSTVSASSEREFVRALDELLLGRAEIRIIMHATAPSDTQMTEQQEGAIISSQQRPILREPGTKEEKP